ncbi:hypothetical protein IV43_GL000955 [Ligilactobacillus acidipiscis]|uniref:Uncharacterized protein n=1 Tax=Ligilactobacillus acidipiscis TaxID=89059 RepID=A0A0R2JB11_9LACO|nr:hypothetical protein IV43_GL000955 [Ligilactobacillus acidipiscis]
MLQTSTTRIFAYIFSKLLAFFVHFLLQVGFSENRAFVLKMNEKRCILLNAVISH